jgi:hypothetical protein
MKITGEQIQNNKDTFIALVSSINRPGFDKGPLLNKLEASDFYTAPASTRYHASYEGGLCQHCLNVYRNIVELNKNKKLNLDENSLLIVSLFHDISKMNFYEKTYRNKKVYLPSGTKHDNGGNFDWVAEEGYQVIEQKSRFLFGNHEQTSEFILRSFVPLSYEESIAILHHHAGMSEDCAKDNISAVLNRYPLALALHLADMMACYIDESEYHE